MGRLIGHVPDRMAEILRPVLHGLLRMLHVEPRMVNPLLPHQPPISVETIVPPQLYQRVLVGLGIVQVRMDELHKHVPRIFHR